jgi:hypothetical protein
MEGFKQSSKKRTICFSKDGSDVVDFLEVGTVSSYSTVTLKSSVYSIISSIIQTIKPKSEPARYCVSS